MSAEGGSPGGRVYFVQAGEGGPIKIGWTGGSPRARMASLQTGNPEPLRLLASAPGTPEDERGLHERFAAHRMTGEWFRAAAEIVAFVAGVAWAERSARLDLFGEEPEFSDEQVDFIRGMVAASTALHAAHAVVLALETRPPGAALPDDLSHLARSAARNLGWLFAPRNGDRGPAQFGAAEAPDADDFDAEGLLRRLREALAADAAARESEAFS